MNSKGNQQNKYKEAEDDDGSFDPDADPTLSTQVIGLTTST